MSGPARPLVLDPTPRSGIVLSDGRQSPPVSAPRGALTLHVTTLVMALATIAGAGVLKIRDGREVVVPVVNKPLPGTCTFQSVTGIPCPGCGLTRSFISLARGNLADAWRYNPAGMPFFALVAFQIPYRLGQIARIRRGLPERQWVSLDRWVVTGLVAVLLVHWGVVIVAGRF